MRDMPISTTYEIPHLNMTFTADALETMTASTGYHEDRDYDFLSPSLYRTPRLVAYFFRFNDGSNLTVDITGDNQIKITIKVDLVEGKMYQLGRDGKKWLALCRYDEEYGELTLFPTTRRKYAPLVRESDRMKYTFYKEFDHNYKEYL